MRPLAVPAVLLVLTLSTGALAQAPAAPDPQKGQQLAANGNPNGAAPCSQCHGADGRGDPAGPFPRLAGQPAFYLYKQLDDYASGARQNAIMEPIAKALSDQERQDAAAYYAGLTAPWPTPPAVDAKAMALGRTLAVMGSLDQRVQGCGNCHGPEGAGVAPTFPQLAGQYASYAQAQLDAWRQGTRQNDVAGAMREVATKLSPEESAAVTAYLEAQRPTGLP